MTKNNCRVKYIDGLRAIAILAVVFHHFGLEIDFSMGGVISSILNFLTMYGWVGVEVFFFLSGFMMSEKYTITQLSGVNIFQFIWGRVKGIYPLLIVNLLFSVYLYPFANMLQVFRTLLFLHCGLFRNPNSGLLEWDIGGATWFLGPLVFCYILYYLINKYCCHENNDEIKYLVYIILSVVGMICIEGNFQYIVFNIYIGRGLAGFFMGVIYNTLIKQLLKKLDDYVVVVACIGLLSCTIWTFIRGNCGNLNIVFDLIVIPAIMSLCERVLFIRKILGNTIFSLIGANSVALYLLHLPVMRLMKRILQNIGIIVFTEIQLLEYILVMTFITVIATVITKKYFKR